MKIGEFINNYLTEHQISRRQFASSVGVSPAYMSMLINGENSSTGKPILPSYPVIAKIAQSMGLSVDALITSVDDFDIYLPAAIKRDEYAEQGIAARIAETKETLSRKSPVQKTALDNVIDQLMEYRKTAAASLAPDELRLIDACRHMTTATQKKLRDIAEKWQDF